MNNILSKFVWLLLFAMILGQILIRQEDNQSNNNSVVTSPINNQGELYQVKQGSIYDGDTIRVISPTGEESRVRFACIDAPEMDQPLGRESRDHLRNLLSRHNNQVRLDVTNIDRYGRKIAVLHLPNGEIVQEMQVREGWVFPYPQYKRDCPVWDNIESADAIARRNGVNVYRGDIDPPWEHRRR